MSQENVEAFKRAIDAFNRRDVEALLDELDPEVEWHPGIAAALLGGEATVYRGHDGIREWLRDVSDAFAELRVELSEIVDRDDRIVAIGRFRARGRKSGADTESPAAYLVEVTATKARVVRIYLDPAEALAAASLREG
jgi:ketosteroid isomerase-like protein